MANEAMRWEENCASVHARTHTYSLTHKPTHLYLGDLGGRELELFGVPQRAVHTLPHPLVVLLQDLRVVEGEGEEEGEGERENKVRCSGQAAFELGVGNGV